MTELALAVFASETGTHLLHPPLNRRWSSHLRSFDARAYEDRLAARGLRFVPRTAPEFPQLLRAIHDPPPGLFLRGSGDIGLLSRAAVAVVGARACSGYGAAVGRSLGRDLTRGGLLVVSGMARGIDAEAHRGALEAGGPTVAVLGCGIDRDYPAAHAELARRIAATGLLVSEYAPGLALEEGREVFTVPGEISSALSAGTNALLKLGAAPLTAAADVLMFFGIEEAAPAERDALLDLLPATADELVRRTGRPAAEIARALVELELAGAAAAHEGIYRVQ